jgi:hypothetical protein
MLEPALQFKRRGPLRMRRQPPILVAHCDESTFAPDQHIGTLN